MGTARMRGSGSEEVECGREVKGGGQSEGK